MYITKLKNIQYNIQSDDKYIADGYNIDIAKYEHGEILEGTTCNLRNT